ncbi:transposase [Cuniculiplasma sp. SKW3]|uniref:transposase n=1 Tax=Cuniculiplasma sp. SKW3 TaxID=3400170 RepID=UPI003FD49F96
MEGKVKQEFIRYVGKEMNSSVVRKVSSDDIRAIEVRRSLDVEMVHRISSSLGINSMIPMNASVMVYSQLLDRPAINRMPEYLQETEILRYLGIESIDTKDLYESLQEINDMDFSAMEEKLASIFLGIEKDRRSVIIDVTDTYFTGDSIDSRPRKGKEGRIKKLIQIALVVTEKRGFPLFHRIYPGNVSNRSIMDDIVKDLWLKDYTAIIMDRGMSDPKRIKSMLDLKFTMISGLKKTPDLKRIIDGIDRNEIYTKKRMVSLKNTKVY